MNYKKVAQVAMLAGKIMLESNAETYRVEETVEHILKLSQLENIHAFAVPTGLFITLDDVSVDAISLNCRIKKRTTDLNKIHIVNDISRQLSNHLMEIDDAYQMLKNLNNSNYTDLQRYISIVILVMSFTLMFKGTVWDSVISLFNGLIFVFMLYINKRINLNLFLLNAISSASMVIFTILMTKILPSVFSIDAIMIGSIMSMVPGTIFTNAIRDTFYEDYTSGMSRALEAGLIAVSIAVGVAVGFLVMGGAI